MEDVEEKGLRAMRMRKQLERESRKEEVKKKEEMKRKTYRREVKVQVGCGKSTKVKAEGKRGRRETKTGG